MSQISIHAPLTGCDLGIEQITNASNRISIHAPLTGCDRANGLLLSFCANFNPRTPHGVRPWTIWFSRTKKQFQSTHPSRGATAFFIPHPLQIRYFNPRTPHGVRPQSGPDLAIPAYFNPRTPHGVRRGINAIQGQTDAISIHAPLTGCDVTRAIEMAQDGEFQSTHPSRGATRDGTGRTRPRRISIHAPLTGCDGATPNHRRKESDFNPRTPHGVRRMFSVPKIKQQPFQSTHPSRGATMYRLSGCSTSIFQSTHPSRGATIRAGRTAENRTFQSTHPSRGATVSLYFGLPGCGISIHAPLTGCDLERLSRFCRYPHFNPRTPHGVRQDAAIARMRLRKFQSTHPSRGATFSGSSLLYLRQISIHAPLTGCDGKNCRFEQQFLRLGSREAGSVRPSANQTGTAQKFIFCVPSAVRGGREFPDRFPFARFRSLRPSAGR